MFRIERLEGALLRHRIIAEIRELGDRQDALLRAAQFVGMTDEESAEYCNRAARIADLVRQLTMVYSAPNHELGGRHEQEAEEAAGESREGHSVKTPYSAGKGADRAA
jgi:hypothetical protein